MKITVCIITKNRLLEINHCLISLKNQTVKPNEILIINAGNKNSLIKEINKYIKDLNIHLIQSKKSKLFRRFLGYKKTKSPIVAYLDDDCIADKDWIKNIALAHKNNPKIIAITGKCINNKTNYISKINQHYYDLWIQRHLYQKNLIQIIDTKNCSLKKTEKFKFKLDKEIETNNNGEDNYLAILLRQQRFEILYDTNIRVGHNEKDTFLKSITQRYENGKVKAYLNWRWKDFKPKKIIHSKNIFNQFLNIFFYVGYINETIRLINKK